LDNIEQELLNIAIVMLEIGPVRVLGDAPALNNDDFQLLGYGVQNLMLAYHEVNADIENESSDQEMALNIDAQYADADMNPQEQNLDYFHFHEFVHPELAHLQLWLAQTYVFPIEEEPLRTFSKEGLELWEISFLLI
jgi:hypothetical protein